MQDAFYHGMLAAVSAAAAMGKPPRDVQREGVAYCLWRVRELGVELDIDAAPVGREDLLELFKDLSELGTGEFMASLPPGRSYRGELEPTSRQLKGALNTLVASRHARPVGEGYELAVWGITVYAQRFATVETSEAEQRREKDQAYEVTGEEI